MAAKLTHGEASVFQHKSFSTRSFSDKSWKFDGVAPVKKPDVEWLGGGSGLGFLSRQQSEADKRLEREELGIVPAEVKRLAEVVALADLKRYAIDLC